MAIGFALVFGVLEGVEAAALRSVAHVQATGKVSLDILWVSPLFHLVLNALVAAVIGLFLLAGVRVRPAFSITIFAFTGALGVVLYSAYIGHLASVVLAAGVAVQAARLAPRIQAWRGWRPLIAVLLLFVVALPVGLRARAAAGAHGSAPAQVQPGTSAGRNVLLIVLDTVRADYLSAWGQARNATPNLDRLAAEGALFSRAYSPSSWTLPSHASLLTGLPTYAHGVRTWDRLAASQLQVQEVLSGLGYATGAFVSNSVNVVPEWGFGEGFDRFDVYDFRTLVARTTLGRSLKRGLRLLDIDLDPYRPASVIGERVREWVSNIGDRRFFALINFMDAHAPYGPPGSRLPLRTWDLPDGRTNEQKGALADAYARAIRGLDADLGRLLADFARERWWNETLVIVVSDHGEEIADGSFDHGNDLRLEEIHVPLIVRLPGTVPAGLRIDTPVSTNDVAATIEELTNPGSRSVPGRSLLRFLGQAGENGGSAEPPILSELEFLLKPDLLRSLVHGDFHYIRETTSGTERLYRYTDDPLEQRNLAADPASEPVLRQMREALQRIPAPESRR